MHLVEGMLKYVGEDSEAGNMLQSLVTVIRSRNVAVKY